MVDIEDLSKGMKVRLIKLNASGDFQFSTLGINKSMWKYFGNVVTISRIRGQYINIKEDHRRWCWFPEFILEVVDYGDNMQPLGDDGIFNFLMEGVAYSYD